MTRPTDCVIGSYTSLRFQRGYTVFMFSLKSAVFRKGFLCVAILFLCLIAGMDDVPDFWRPMNIGVAVMQSSGGQEDDGGEHSPKTVCHQGISHDAAAYGRQPFFIRACPDEIKRQADFTNRRVSRKRAPPSFS